VRGDFAQSGSAVKECSASCHDLDGEWRQYLLNISQISGEPPLFLTADISIKPAVWTQNMYLAILRCMDPDGMRKLSCSIRLESEYRKTSKLSRFGGFTKIFGYSRT